MIVYLEGEAHLLIVENGAVMPPPDRVVKIVVSSPTRPGPGDVCSWGQFRRALRRVYARAEAELGRQALVEVVVLAGYYGLIGFVLNAFEADLPAGATSPF